MAQQLQQTLTLQEDTELVAPLCKSSVPQMSGMAGFGPWAHDAQLQLAKKPMILCSRKIGSTVPSKVQELATCG